MTVILFGTVASVEAQVVIDIIKHQELVFGMLNREQEKSVDYTTPEAALFEIRGAPRKNVDINVSVYTPSLNENQLLLTIRPQDIAYSRDGGISWTECKSTTLGWKTQFPKTTGGVPGVILVRVGGTIAASSGQQRGEYRGTVRLKASYTN